MAALPQERQVPLLLVLLAVVVGYLGYTGTGLDQLGLRGRDADQGQHPVARQKTLDSLIILTDSAKKLLAAGSGR